jgi:hypothetical protein
MGILRVMRQFKDKLSIAEFDLCPFDKGPQYVKFTVCPHN